MFSTMITRGPSDLQAGEKPFIPIITLPMMWLNIVQSASYWIGFGGYSAN